MAIEDVGLGTTRNMGYEHVFIDPGFDISNIYAVCTTEYADCMDSMNCSVSWRFVNKGTAGTGSNTYMDWQIGSWNNLPASQCHVRQDASTGRHYWAMSLRDMIVPNTNPKEDGVRVTDPITLLFPNGFQFDQRKYDAIEFSVGFRFIYTQEFATAYGQATSERGEATCHIYYRPDLSITAVKTLANGSIRIAYSQTGSWSRAGDRFAVNRMYVRQSGGRLREVIEPATDAGATVYGRAAGDGTMVIPANQVLFMPSDGDDVYCEVRYVPNYCPVGFEFLRITNRLTVIDYSTCETPRVSVTATNNELGTVLVTVSGTGDKSVSMTGCKVKVTGLPGEFVVSEGRTISGFSIAVPFAPLGVESTVQAVAFAGTGSDDDPVSKAVESSPFTIPAKGPDGYYRYLMQSVEDPTICAAARINVEEQVKVDRAQDSYELNGRTSPSVGYGTVVNRSISLSFDLDTTDDYTGLTYTATKPEDVERVAESRVVIYRTPFGKRHFVTIKSATIDRYKAGIFRGMSVNMDEVDYGG